MSARDGVVVPARSSLPPPPPPACCYLDQSLLDTHPEPGTLTTGSSLGGGASRRQVKKTVKMEPMVMVMVNSCVLRMVEALWRLTGETKA